MSVVRHIPERPDGEEWEVIVVGTGMGGSTVGYQLARLGRRVLFVEKGRLLQLGSPVPLGPGMTEVELRLGQGRWPLTLQGETNDGELDFFAPLGCGAGGTTALFGAQLERFRPTDFEPRRNFPDIPDTSLPERWPITYEELLPHYRAAEGLFRVCGTQDPLCPDPEGPLREPPPLSARDEVLRDSLVSIGLHPYRSHVGYHYLSDCQECLDICYRGCKGDAAGRALAPALASYGASILPECEVKELIADGSRVVALRAMWRGNEIRLAGKVIILASGAFMTPKLLLESRSPKWPEGLGNGSGMVGRNLMLHTSDVMVVDHRDMHSAEGPMKSLTLNDFYFDDGKKLGTFQAMGLPILEPVIRGFLQFVQGRTPGGTSELMSRSVPKLAKMAEERYRRASVYATIVEDLPYPENRIVLDSTANNGRRFVYGYPAELEDRNRRLRKAVKRVLAPKHKVTCVTRGRNNINYGHVCGTCRFGDDPKTSVLDASNRVHDLDNLYVVDASFFPSSGGINPSLTVAANGLRVGRIVHDRMP